MHGRPWLTRGLMLLLLSSSGRALGDEADNPAPDAPADAPPESAPRLTNSEKLAQQRFREAFQAYNEGRFAAAASLFEAADRLAPHASVRYNAAAAWDDAGEVTRAATGYEAALAQGTLDESRERTARERLSELRKTLGHVRVLQPLGAFVTVDHVQRTPVPTSFYLRPGSYEIMAEYRGTRSTTTATIRAGDEQVVKLNLPFATTVTTPPPAEAPAAPLPAQPKESDSISQSTWGWIGIGAGVAFTGAAIFMGLRALEARKEYNASEHTDADALHAAENRRLATNVLWGGAAVSGVTGVVLLLTAPRLEF